MATVAAAGRKPPFATNTLARLYLAQGHWETAAALAAELDPAAGVRHELARALDARVRLLEELLDRVRTRRRARARGAG